MNRTRAFAALLMIAAAGALAHAARVQGPPRQAQLASLPYQVSQWTGRDAAAPDAETLRILAADSYLNRSYAGASGTPIDLYIAYYGRQRPGVSIHSPLHCLPGTGWEPLDVATATLSQPDGRQGEHKCGDIDGRVIQHPKLEKAEEHREYRGAQPALTSRDRQQQKELRRNARDI